jgi:hypothetical protein
MDFAELLSVVDQLPPEDLAVLKEHIRQREADQKREAAAWGTALEEAAADFRGDSSPEELRNIFESINHKSPPSEKGL